MLQINPLKSVIPIIKYDQNEQRAIPPLLGTGFLVAPASLQSEPIIVTAKHVLEGVLSKPGEVYCAISQGFLPKYPLCAFSEKDVKYSDKTDLAAFNWPNPPRLEPLPLARARLTTGEDVIMVEFSDTEVKEEGGVEFHFVMHKGNILAYHHKSRVESIEGMPALETSFPAFRGASGAPVISARPGFPVAGLAVANLERELLPAKVYKYRDGESIEETTTYFLPRGHAIAAEVLIDFLSGIGFAPHTV